MIRKYLCKYQQIIGYLFWGVLTTIVNWGSYSAVSLFLSGTFSVSAACTVTISNILSWIFATAFAFVTNKIWVFHSRNWSRLVFLPELGKFVSSRLATGAFEILAVPFLVKIGLNQKVLGVEGMVSKIIISFLVVVLNYFLSKFMVFKKQKSESAGKEPG